MDRQSSQKRIEEIYEDVVALRRHIHQNPELSRQEEKTMAFVSEYLTRLNIPHKTNVGGYGIVAAPVANKALPFCNIVCITGSEMAEKLSGYLAVLHEANPQSVGGKLPGDDFYFGK